MHGTGRDLTAHQIRSKCSGGGDNSVRRRSGFLALFDNADTIVNTAECSSVCVCHLTLLIIMHTVNRPDELIPLWYLHGKAPTLGVWSVYVEPEGEGGRSVNTRVSDAVSHSEVSRANVCLRRNFNVKYNWLPTLTNTHTHTKKLFYCKTKDLRNILVAPCCLSLCSLTSCMDDTDFFLVFQDQCLNCICVTVV